MRLLFCLFFGCCVLGVPLRAVGVGPLEGGPHGVLAQGGYAIGKVAQGSKVKFNGKPVFVGPEGHFLLGFGRQEETEGVLTITEENGTETKQHLTIKKRTYPTQHIKGVAPKHVNPDPAAVARSAKEAAKIKAARARASAVDGIFTPFALPVKPPHQQTGVYGSSRTYNGEERNWHKGLDLAAPTGTPVFAPADGVVVGAFEETFFNGNLIVLDHGYGLFSIYAHLDSMSAKVGQLALKGSKLGTVGQTGRATGPHLHWGVYWYNTPLDPTYFLEHNNKN